VGVHPGRGTDRALLPGAELAEVIDDRTWKGQGLVKFGPVQMSFSGTVVMEERNDVAHRAKLSAKGAEQRGKGVANATVESWLELAGDDGTTVHIRSDITITGAAAQMSRGLLPGSRSSSPASSPTAWRRR
jgi:carbon monoxide dehydrogenase subunit G